MKRSIPAKAAVFLFAACGTLCAALVLFTSVLAALTALRVFRCTGTVSRALPKLERAANLYLNNHSGQSAKPDR